MELTPDFLLANPELVTPAAPWCVRLDNLELGTVLAAQPWLAGEGLRRADLERQIAHLASELPLGPVYFQRVKRAVARLEEIGALRGVGEERTRRFLTTPQGFAAFLLNLHVLGADPTVDGAEFELKRAFAAMSTVVMERLMDLPGEVDLPPEIAGFFAEVEQLTVLGQRVITDEVAQEALDVLRLIASQRVRVGELLQEARRRLVKAESGAAVFRALHLSRLEAEMLLRGAAIVQDIPRLNHRATVLRYEHYLRYLDELGALHAKELKGDPLDAIRALMARWRKDR